MKTIAKSKLGHGCGACRKLKAFAMRQFGLVSLAAYCFGLGDAAAQTWVQVRSMSVPRDLHTATLLSDGRALIAGGPLLSSAELFDPVAANWNLTGPMTTNRYLSTATLLPNGKVLVVGGLYYSSLASAELFDPATSTWRATASMTTGHNTHTATLLPNGKVLVAGGFSGLVGQGIATAEPVHRNLVACLTDALTKV
jgi:hypothetical protein